VPGKDTLLFGGNTTCLEVMIGKNTLIIDAGTGIIELGKKIAMEYFQEGKNTPLEITILFTHLHHDHTQGLPFFIPLYLGQSILHFFGPQNFGEELNTVLERSMKPPNFPINFTSVQSVKNITTLKENHIVLLDVKNPTPKIINKALNKPDIKDSTIVIKVMNDYSHPANGVFVYRIEYQKKSIVFCTDVEGYILGNRKLIQFARGADLLIHDAQYTKEQYTSLPTPKQGYGHSTPEMAIEVAEKAEVKKLALTHHDPTAMDEHLENNQKKYRGNYNNLFFARDGYTVQI
jgi:ribonuclease BN (tRNA processing enzyme)